MQKIASVNFVLIIICSHLLELIHPSTYSPSDKKKKIKNTSKIFFSFFFTYFTFIAYVTYTTVLTLLTTRYLQYSSYTTYYSVFTLLTIRYLHYLQMNMVFTLLTCTIRYLHHLNALKLYTILQYYTEQYTNLTPKRYLLVTALQLNNASHGSPAKYTIPCSLDTLITFFTTSHSRKSKCTCARGANMIEPYIVALSRRCEEKSK